MILTPRSKSMRLNFLQRSQWHNASSGNSGIQPPSFTTTLSLASRPSGTSSFGMFGMEQSCKVRSFSHWAFSASSCLLISLRAVTFFFISSASSFLPSFISIPMRADSFFVSERLLSSFCWASRRRRSVSMTSAMASSAFSKCFFFNPLITRSVSSFMSLSVSMCCKFKKSDTY